MPELPITYRGTIYPWHCDHMGHMNVMWYVGKFDEATWQFLSKLGLSPSRLSKEGTGMAAVEQHIEYKRELRAGDLITNSDGRCWRSKRKRFDLHMRCGMTKAESWP